MTRRRKRYFFIHVMRTGGTTLSRQLRRNFEPGEVYPDYDLDITHDGQFRHLELPYVMSLRDDRRAAIKLYMGHFLYVTADVLGGDFITFTLLRDPVERTLSLLKQLQRGAIDSSMQREPQRPDWRSDMTELTLEAIYDDPFNYKRLIRNHQTKVFSATRDEFPNSFLTEIDVDDARLAVAKKNLANVDVVGVTERYKEFVGELTRRFGWQLRTGGRANETDAIEIDPVFRRRIADDNAIDVEFYEYARAIGGSQPTKVTRWRTGR
jgi:hypothetical protein